MSPGKPRRIFPALAAIIAMLMALALQSGVTTAVAVPVGPTDATKVPHYFGPWPNWANSPLTLSTAAVTISGAGAGAAAVAQVDPATGGIKSIEITSPGHDYVGGATVAVAGSTGTAATASATVSASGVVMGFNGIAGGAGHTSFATSLSGGGGTGATAIASGGVDALTIGDGGAGYTMPTVDFDLPDDPSGTVAKAHVPMVAKGDPVDGMDASGTITAVVVDDPGAGYATAPAVSIRNGTQFDPINLAEGGSIATATTTLALSAVNVVAFGTGYTSAPSVAISDPAGSGTGAAASALTDVGAVTSITVDTPGDGYLTKGMKKFVDDLPVTCTPGDATSLCPTAPGAKFIPNAVPAQKTYDGVKADEYVIGLVQYRTSFSSDLPQGTLVRGYVQLVAPAERADAIVDFSKFAGKTLILYNDAPAAFPARVPSYDYYTGGPDLSPVGAPTVMPGYGPNTRTVMQVTIAATSPAPAFDLAKLQAAFRHNAAGTGVFESGQHPVIVGQAAYNSAYGTSFAASSNCNAPGSTVTRCDGLVRVSDTSTFGFNTLKAPNAKMTLPLGPKALRDEMNSTTFDEFGRMQATMGIEAQPPTPGAQNVTLYPYVNPSTELIDATNLPKAESS